MSFRRSYVLRTLLLVLCLASGLVSASVAYRSRFESARSLQDVGEMQRLLLELEKEVGAGKLNLRLLLSEVYLELGTWGEQRTRRKFLDKADNLARELLKTEPSNGLAYYVASVATSRLIEYHLNPFEKLNLLNQFDQLMPKAIELLQDPLYRGFALMGMGLRYTNPPWPFNDFRKAEAYFKEAEQFLSSYSGFYLNFGMFYMKAGDRKKAREMFEKALSTPEHPLFKKAHEESIGKAREYLKELGGRG